MPAEPVLGQFAIFPYTFAPLGWARCDGQTLTIADNSALYSILGTRYGGDGQATFQLPDLRVAESNQYRNLPMPGGKKALGYHIATEGLFPSSSGLGVEPFVGELLILTTTYSPEGYLECRGQLLPINQNQALFALIGTTYGGDGVTTFRVPDMRSNLPVPGAPDGVVYHKGFEGLPYVRYHISLYGIFPSRN